jgi:hypothetical protein
MKEKLECEVKVMMSADMERITKELALTNWQNTSSYIRSLIAKDYQLNIDKLSNRMPFQTSIDFGND